MRNVNTNALTEIQRQYGLESILIVRVWWSDLYYDYSDKVNLGADAFGRILEISGIDNVLGIDKSSTSASVSVTLDDSDGQLKQIIDNVDIHKVKVQVLQWFAGRPKSDAFVIFTGQINSPIEWSEGNRTLRFDVVNMVENLELGFSLEEGIIQGIPATAYGRPFPLVFGTAYRVPSLRLSESPSGILAQGFALVNDDEYNAELAEYDKKIQAAFNIAAQLYQEATGASLLAAQYNDGDFDANSPPDDYGTYQSYLQAANQLYAQSEQYSVERENLLLERIALAQDYEQKKAYALKQVQIASANFPRGVPVVVEIDNTRLNVRFDGVVMNIIGEVQITNSRPKQVFHALYNQRDVSNVFVSEKTTEKFKWFDAGSRIRVISVPMYYVACFGYTPTITAVYARVKGVRTVVPSQYYTVSRVPFTNSLGNVAYGTVVTMTQPPTTILDANGEPLYESDDIWCDIIGEVPGQFIHIMFWILATFTNLQADPDSFNDAFVHTQNTPMNFVVTERKNVMDFIRDLCHLARCAVWVDDTTVRLRYLPAAVTQVETITPDDVVEDSLVITCDPTENLTTKLISNWKMSGDQEQPNKFIARMNIQKYGLHEQTMDCFAYNTHEIVERVTIFWLIRLATTWKKLKLKTFISKLKLESHDPVLLSGWNGLFCNTDVVGIVESAVYDSSSNTIDMVIWLPVRWGEMNIYDFAYTADTTDLWGDPNLPDFQTGNPFQNAHDTTGFLPKVTSGFISRGEMPPVNKGPVQVNDTPPQFQITTAVNMPINPFRPSGFEDANAKKKYELKDPTPVTVEDTNVGNADIGTVVDMGANNHTYKVKLTNGTLVTATQRVIADGYRVPNDIDVPVVKKNGKWYMAAPEWAKEATS
jgi:hypothetical protein